MISEFLIQMTSARWRDPAKIGSRSRSRRNVSSFEARPPLYQDLAQASSLRSAHSFGMPPAATWRNIFQQHVAQHVLQECLQIAVQHGDFLRNIADLQGLDRWRESFTTASPKPSKKSSPWRNFGKLLSETSEK